MPKADAVRKLSKGGCVKIQKRGEVKIRKFCRLVSCFINHTKCMFRVL